MRCVFFLPPRCLSDGEELRAALETEAALETLETG
jgi:hypothetical protein